MSTRKYSNHRNDYTLHDVMTRRQTEVANRKRRWMQLLAGPDSRKYARMLFGLPPLEDKQ